MNVKECYKQNRRGYRSFWHYKRLYPINSSAHNFWIANKPLESMQSEWFSFGAGWEAAHKEYLEKRGNNG
jgi:hypothetical protein